jgi:hypothetical protein
VIKLKGHGLLVGAFGEKAVETELLRRNWIPANVNASIKNSADFDIFAKKGARTVHIRVKTCGADHSSFQFGGFKPGLQIQDTRFSKTDYTVLVKMGTAGRRENDVFYVIPTATVRKRIAAYRDEYLRNAKRNGEPRKDIGHWTLHLKPLRNGEKRFNYDCARHWKTHLENWKALERA